MFLPGQLVLHIDEYTKQKQENNTREAKEAQKWGLSVEELRAQEEMLSKRNTYEVREAKKWGMSVEEYRAQNEMISKHNTYEVREAKKWGMSVEELRAQEEMISKRNTYEVREAKKWGMSVEEYRAQKEMMSMGNEERDKIRVNLPDNQQHDEENLSIRGKPKDLFPPIRPGESVEQRLGVDEMQKQQMEYERIQKEHKRRHSEDYEMIEGGFRMNEVEDSFYVPPYSSISSQLQHHVISHSQHQDGNLDHISSGLAVGTLVQMTSRGGAPMTGVIKWVGIVPHYEGYVAGVELVSNINLICKIILPFCTGSQINF